MSREQAASIGQHTQQILQQGGYTTATGVSVDLRPLLTYAVAHTQSYPPQTLLPSAMQGDVPTAISVTNETTLQAAQRLVEAGERVAALNFASARHPGGGWLSGARAQEESLARASGLVPCIASDPMYARHQRQHDALYTSSAIYSPDVPVFRDDDGQLLEQPYRVSFITAPAVNAGVALQRDRSRREEVTTAMLERVERVLAIAARHRHTAIVLGAWGCGVFKNDPYEIASLFAQAIYGPFRGTFAVVVFAVLDSSPEHRFIRPFEQAFRQE